VIGYHLIAECRGAIAHQGQDELEQLLLRMAQAGGASVLASHFHPFEGGGVTGVLLLKESHISIHTWPEHDYAAVDVFMCGQCNVDAARSCLQRMFPSDWMQLRILPRVRPEGAR